MTGEAVSFAKEFKFPTNPPKHTYMIKQYRQILFLLSFTAIFIGYLMVWLPGPSAGLQFLGIEMGEWTKFFGLGAKRNWFYLPPLTLALMLLFFTAGWENGRTQTWLFRGVAVAVSLLGVGDHRFITMTRAPFGNPRADGIGCPAGCRADFGNMRATVAAPHVPHNRETRTATVWRVRCGDGGRLRRGVI